MLLNPFFKKLSHLIGGAIFISFLCFGSINILVAQQHKEFIVVLDAGHGGKDPGKNPKENGYKGKYEKEIALNIVLKTGVILEKIPGIKVVYTRKTDVFVDLWERGNIANRVDADLFVSVHCNAHNSQARGSETWVLGVHANNRNFEVAKAENKVILLEENHEQKYKGFNPNSPTSVIGLSLEQEENLDQSLLIASLVQSDFEKSLKRVNRGVKQAGFVVLYQTYMPSILIETGFVTNRGEGQFLSSNRGQQEMAKSIAKSIEDYYNQHKVNVAALDAFETSEIPKDKEEFIPQIPKVVDDGKYYKIQLAASKNRISTSSYNFKGYKNVERERSGGIFKYKYFLGEYETRPEAEEKLLEVKEKGYKSAYIVTYEKEKKKVASKKSNKKEDYFFKVQLASSRNKINPKPANFKGLKVHAVKVGQYYKYYMLQRSNYELVKRDLDKAKSKGYKSAFIASFNGQKIISLKEALNKLSH